MEIQAKKEKEYAHALMIMIIMTRFISVHANFLKKLKVICKGLICIYKYYINVI